MAVRRSRKPALDPVDLVMDLMTVPGTSGQEGGIVERVRQILGQARVPDAAMTTDAAHCKSPIGGESGNLVVKLPGTLRAPRRLLMAHVDTVPLCVGTQPQRRAGRIVSRSAKTGLGADNRAGVAVVLHAALTILRKGLPHPPLTLFFPVQEEIGLVGSRFAGVSKLGRPSFCFNWDGGDPAAVTVGATGAIAMEIEIGGVASHAGVHPEAGVSAAIVAAHAMADLDGRGWHGKISRPEGEGTSNCGIVQGGDALNVVMPSMHVRAEARSHDPRFCSRIVDEFESAFRRAAERVRNDRGRTGTLSFRSEMKYESFRIENDSAVVVAAAAAVRDEGREPRFVVSNGGLDANWMTAHGLPTVTLGCGQHDIHTVDEFLDLDEFLAATRMGLQLATGAPHGQ